MKLPELAAQTRQVYDANYGGDTRTSQAEARRHWWELW
jgi:hypothetical protein